MTAKPGAGSPIGQVIDVDAVIVSSALVPHTPTPAAPAAEGLMAKFNKLHWGTKTALIGGTLALGAALSFVAFRSKHDGGTDLVAPPVANVAAAQTR
jgi:hypothetical protein